MNLQRSFSAFRLVPASQRFENVTVRRTGEVPCKPVDIGGTTVLRTRALFGSCLGLVRLGRIGPEPGLFHPDRIGTVSIQAGPRIVIRLDSARNKTRSIRAILPPPPPGTKPDPHRSGTKPVRRDERRWRGTTEGRRRRGTRLRRPLPIEHLRSPPPSRL